MLNSFGDLNKFSDNDLQSELDRRKQVQQLDRPVPLPAPNFEKLATAVIAAVDHSIENDWWDEDSAHYIFEAAMEAIYGPGYWEWHRKRFK